MAGLQLERTQVHAWHMASILGVEALTISSAVCMSNVLSSIFIVAAVSMDILTPEKYNALSPWITQQ